MAGKVINTYHLGYADLDNLGASFLAVLVQKDVTGVFKVYSGIVLLPPCHDCKYEEARKRAANRIMQAGTPENYDRAITFFPAIPKERYS